jgi:hypothetical protein
MIRIVPQARHLYRRHGDSHESRCSLRRGRTGSRRPPLSTSRPSRRSRAWPGEGTIIVGYRSRRVLPAARDMVLQTAAGPGPGPEARRPSRRPRPSPGHVSTRPGPLALASPAAARPWSRVHRVVIPCRHAVRKTPRASCILFALHVAENHHDHVAVRSGRRCQPGFRVLLREACRRVHRRRIRWPRSVRRRLTQSG